MTILYYLCYTTLSYTASHYIGIGPYIPIYVVRFSRVFQCDTTAVESYMFHILLRTRYVMDP